MVKRLIASVLAAAGCVYALWYSLTPVEIVAVHNGNTLLVRHFPLLKSRQIAWWEANKGMIQARYGIPHKDKEGHYSVYIQDFGDGYRIDPGRDNLLFSGDELLCFDDMTVAARCIVKKPLMSLGSAPNAPLYYD